MSELPQELENVEMGPSPEGSLPTAEPTSIQEPIMPTNEFTEESGHALESFKKHMVEFNKALDEYAGSKKQLSRAWANAALSPLNQIPLEWSYPAEKEMFNIFDELNSAKFILMVHGLADAGVLTLHKPLMMATPATPSERQLRDKMNNLTNGPVIELGKRELPPTDSL
jgi:hypothetical protein